MSDSEVHEHNNACAVKGAKGSKSEEIVQPSVKYNHNTTICVPEGAARLFSSLRMFSSVDCAGICAGVWQDLPSPGETSNMQMTVSAAPRTGELGENGRN